MKIKKCKFCKSKAITNFTKSKYFKPHIYCIDCNAHYYNNKWWTRKEWYDWVNSESESFNEIKTKAHNEIVEAFKIPKKFLGYGE